MAEWRKYSGAYIDIENYRSMSISDNGNLIHIKYEDGFVDTIHEHQIDDTVHTFMLIVSKAAREYRMCYCSKFHKDKKDKEMESIKKDIRAIKKLLDNLKNLL